MLLKIFENNKKMIIYIKINKSLSIIFIYIFLDYLIYIFQK